MGLRRPDGGPERSLGVFVFRGPENEHLRHRSEPSWSSVGALPGCSGRVGGPGGGHQSTREDPRRASKWA